MTRRNLTAGVLAVVAAGTLAAQADTRQFAFSYEAEPFTPGSFEYEQWITWQTRDGFDRLDFRHEFCFGITERLNLGFYVPNWRWEKGKGSEIHDIAMEVIYNFTDPNESWLGTSIYNEIKGWEDFLELESKLLLQKNFGPLTAVYNVGLEAEWEEEGLSESKGEFFHSVGLGYSLNEKLGVGFEMLHEVALDNWETGGPSALYVGPNISARPGNLWATVAGLWQVTDEGEEPDFQLRAIVGIHF